MNVIAKSKSMMSDEGAVSPVIGVILMVAVTVVLAAVIASFVFGIGDDLGEPAPNAQIEFDYDDDTGEVFVVHTGGDAIPENSELDFTGDGDVNFDQPDNNINEEEGVGVVQPGGVTAGDVIGSGTLDNGEEERLVWQAPDGDNSATLGTFEAPGE